MCLFAEEREIGLVAVVLEQPLECGTDGAFVLFAESFILFEFGVVVFDGFVCGFDVEIWHGLIVVGYQRSAVRKRRESEFPPTDGNLVRLETAP